MNNFDKTIEKLTPMFSEVADKIGQGAEFGWEVVVRQQFAYGVKDLVISLMEFITMIIVIIVAVGVVKFMSKERAKETSNYDKSDWTLGIMFIIGTLTCIIGGLLYSLTCSLSEGILHVINPSYYALEFFINLAK